MTFPKDEDGQVLAGLAEDGVDLSRSRLIEFAVAVPDEATATRVAAAVRAAGYETEIYYDEGEPDFDGNIDDAEEFGPSWTVYANVDMVPTYKRIVAIQAELDKLVLPIGGKVDGWGTPVEPEERSR